MDKAKPVLTNVTYVQNMNEVALGCDALVIATEWPEFKKLDLERVRKELTHPIIFDGRNLFDVHAMERLGFIGAEEAIAAVRIARDLTEQGIDAVPVFWMATEDHDLDEVRRVSFFGDGKLVKFELPANVGNLAPVGRILLGSGIEALQSEAMALLGAQDPGSVAQILSDTGPEARVIAVAAVTMLPITVKVVRAELARDPAVFVGDLRSQRVPAPTCPPAPRRGC
jgi:hypothetical protein